MNAGDPEALRLQPTDERVRDRQVYLAGPLLPGESPTLIYLLRPDGSFTRYALIGGP